jgi:hypothetical protein
MRRHNMNSRTLARLARMSPQEIVFRIGAVAGHALDRPLDNAGFRREPARDRTRPFAPLWIASEEERRVPEAIRSRASGEVDAVVAEADAVLLGRFRLLGRSYALGRPIPWCTDPVSGRPWPTEFHRAIDIFSGDGGRGDVKDVWELNRHQFLPTLGKAYRMTGEERYAAGALDLVEEWIAANPYKRGINWTSALEVAVRSLAWCWTLGMVEGSAALDAVRRGRVEGSLAAHARYIEENLSFYFSPYNHLVGEATGLFILGSMLEERARAARWRRLGWRILIETMASQFHADGGTVEQASGYHFFTQGFYLQAFLHAGRRGESIPDPAWALFGRTFDYASALQRPDGTMPMIGDGDEGKAIALRQPSPWDFRPYLAIGAALFARADLRQAAGPFPPDAAWLLGVSRWDAYDRLPAAGGAVGSAALRESGYVVLADPVEPAHALLFDAGPIAEGVPFDDRPSAAHGHADALSFEWTAFGRPILVDPGFFTYNGDAAWHRYFRETEAHNALVVDGASQAAYRGRLTWSSAPRVRLHRFDASPGFAFAEGSHDAYERMRPPLRYRRSILYVAPDYWLVRDELEGSGSHEVDRALHFAPGVEASADPDGVLWGHAGDGVAFLVQACDSIPSAVDLRRGGPEPAGGWVATGYGARVPAFVARIRSTVTAPAALHLLLTAGRTPTPRDTLLWSVERDAGAGVIVVRRGGGAVDVIAYGMPGAVTEAGGIRTNARVACVRLDAAGSVLASFRAGGTLLAYRDRDLAKTATPIPDPRGAKR